MKHKTIFLVVLVIGIFIVGTVFALLFLNEKHHSKHPIQRAEAKQNNKKASISNTMKQFEDIMDQYFRNDPVQETNNAVNKMVDDYNQLIKEGQKNIEDKKIKLDERIAIIRKIESQISDLDKKLNKINADAKNKKSIAEYNILVKKRNDLVEKHKSHSGLYKEYETDVNKLIKHLNEKSELQRKNIEKAKKTAEEVVTHYHNWINDDGDLAFFNELNRYYALLYAEKRLFGKKFKKVSTKFFPGENINTGKL